MAASLKIDFVIREIIMSNAQAKVFAAVVSVVTIHSVGDVAEAQIRLDPIVSVQTNTLGALQLAATGEHTAFSLGDRIYAGRAGEIQLLVQNGDPAPGAVVGYEYESLSSPMPSAAGEVAFWGTLNNPNGPTTGMDRGIWVGTPGLLQLLVGNGVPAPGAANANFGVIDPPRMTAAGQVMFTAALTGPEVTASNSSGLWSGAPGALELVARTGDASPIAGVNYAQDFGRGRFAILDATAAGHVALHSVLAGPEVNTSNDKAVFVGMPDNLRPLTRTGSAAAGITGATFANTPTGFKAFAMGEGGQSAFVTSVEGAGIDNSNNRGLWVGTPDEVLMVARTGAQAPGLPAGVEMSGLWGPALNRSGDVAFHAQVMGAETASANNELLYVGSPDGVRLVARSGDPAPGTDWTFGALGNGNVNDTTPILSDDGWVFFHAERAGDNASMFEDQGIWAAAPDGELHLIALEGSIVDIGGGDLREIHSFVLGQSDEGRLLFSAQYVAAPGQPGSGGVVLFNVAVPEPAGAGLMLVAAGLGLVRRRR